MSSLRTASTNNVTGIYLYKKYQQLLAQLILSVLSQERMISNAFLVSTCTLSQPILLVKYKIQISYQLVTFKKFLYQFFTALKV